MRLAVVSGALWFAVACQGASPNEVWTDPDTHLMWTAADNGSGLSWLQAQRYCRDLTLGGLHNWVLPSIDDLQSLVGKSETQTTYRIKAPIKLTGWQWSSTPGKQEGEGWALDFGDGGRASVAAGDSGLNRALCVRPPDRKSRSTANKK
jgi:Protein of unknown function (DUF1566)